MQGRFSQNLPSHAIVYYENPRTTIVAAADTDEKRLTAFQNKWGTRALYADYKLMLKCEKIDMISICTPIHTHYDILRDSAETGIKAIWCEKPLCDDINKAKDIIKICKKKKIILAVNYFRRWSKPYQKLREFIQNGGVGDIQQTACYYSGGILNNGSHLIDILRFFFGEIEWAEGRHFVEEGAKDDPSLDATLWFEKGFAVSLHAFNDACFRTIEIDIFGTKGRIRIKDSVNWLELSEAVKHARIPGLKTLRETTGKDFGNDFMQPMSSALKNLIDCVDANPVRNGVRRRGISNGVKDKNPLCSGEDALKTLIVAQAVKDSFMKKGRRLKIENG